MPLEFSSVPTFLENSSADIPFRILDWRANRYISHLTKSFVDSNLFCPNKTYVFVGLTRDMGQSLCNLFYNHGARNMVLASRTPNKFPEWKAELEARGATIRIEILDVVNLQDVKAFKARQIQTIYKHVECYFPPRFSGWMAQPESKPEFQ